MDLAEAFLNCLISEKCFEQKIEKKSSKASKDFQGKVNKVRNSKQAEGTSIVHRK